MASQQWLVLVVRLPAEPARHRMAVWRELRRVGAVPLAPGVWAVPDVPGIRPGLARIGERTAAANAPLLTLATTGHGDADARRLGELYRQAREEEWAEFLADCEKYLAELDKEHGMGKYTLAELEEEEQSLDRLRRWYRELRARDLLGTPSTSLADQQLKQCTLAFDDFAERVYTQATTPTSDDDHS